MLNVAIIQGRLTRDPELRRTSNGVACCSFSVACERDYRPNGQKETDFFDVVAWRGTAEFVEKWFKKGTAVSVHGRIQTRDYTTKDGQNRHVWEIVAENVYFAEKKSGGGNENTDSYSADAGEFSVLEEDMETELPF